MSFKKGDFVRGIWSDRTVKVISTDRGGATFSGELVDTPENRRLQRHYERGVKIGGWISDNFKLCEKPAPSTPPRVECVEEGEEV